MSNVLPFRFLSMFWRALRFQAGSIPLINSGDEQLFSGRDPCCSGSHTEHIRLCTRLMTTVQSAEVNVNQGVAKQDVNWITGEFQLGAFKMCVSKWVWL